MNSGYISLAKGYPTSTTQALEPFAYIRLTKTLALKYAQDFFENGKSKNNHTVRAKLSKKHCVHLIFQCYWLRKLFRDYPICGTNNAEKSLAHANLGCVTSTLTWQIGVCNFAQRYFNPLLNEGHTISDKQDLECPPNPGLVRSDFVERVNT